MSQIKPTAELQLTLINTAAAFSLIEDEGVFSMAPVQFMVNEYAWLEVENDPASHVFYYAPVDHEAFSASIKNYLRQQYNF